jgi:DNA-binding beta-propeller fold protein YncE
MLAEGIHSLEVSGEGIKSKAISFNVNQDRELNVKTDPPESRLTHQNTLTVGSLPKGMEFTKDGKYLFISLLGEPVVVKLDSESEDMEITKRIEPTDKRYKNAGFVEIGISPLEDAVLASQMTTASVHRIPLNGETPFEITETIPTGGTWSKVIAFNSDGSKFAVSNWTSWDVTIFSYPEMKLLQKINIPGIPRGMAFADEDKTLYVSNYSNGALHKVDLAEGKVVSTITVKRLGALRHLVLDEEKNIMYASDMQMECINVYDLTAFKLIKQIKVDYNPNTIAFSPDKKYLYVSCRGPNAKTTYLDRSPRNSYLYIIDCEKQEVIERRELGNQPTALAVHPSGKYIVVSNFRDKNIEIYQVDER